MQQLIICLTSSFDIISSPSSSYYHSLVLIHSGSTFCLIHSFSTEADDRRTALEPPTKRRKSGRLDCHDLAATSMLFVLVKSSSIDFKEEGETTMTAGEVALFISFLMIADPYHRKLCKCSGKSIYSYWKCQNQCACSIKFQQRGVNQDGQMIYVFSSSTSKWHDDACSLSYLEQIEQRRANPPPSKRQYRGGPGVQQVVRM